MIRIRQIEINALTFNQYDNGISEIVYYESTERAVDGFVYFVDMLIRETPKHKTIYLLSDLSATDHLPLGYHYSQIAKLNSRYEENARPAARFANIYSEMTIQRQMILEYMRSLEMPGVALNMFDRENRNKAISWLLYGCERD